MELVKVKVFFNENSKKIPFDFKYDDFIFRIRSYFNIYNNEIKLFAILKQENNSNIKIEISNQNNLDDYYSTDEFDHFLIEKLIKKMKLIIIMKFKN